jgi:hypothetical protein
MNINRDNSNRNLSVMLLLALGVPDRSTRQPAPQQDVNATSASA